MDLTSWTLPHDALDLLPEVLPSEALVMASSPRHVALTTLGDIDALPAASLWPAYDQGHVFTNDWHIRWRNLGDRTRVVVAGDAPLPGSWESLEATRDLAGADTEALQVILWGRNQPHDGLWIELRIPNLMSSPDQHPADHAAAVDDAYVRRYLQAVTYRDANTASTLFTRYTGLAYAASSDDDTVFDLATS